MDLEETTTLKSHISMVYPVGVPSENSNVLLNPQKCCLLVHDPVVPASVVEECEITLTRTENRKADVSPRRYSTLTTTVCVKLLMNLPSYKGLEAEPAMKSPPWIHTITGRGFKRGNEKLVSKVCITFAGHSSEIGPMQACIQAGLGYVASYTPFHGDNGAGGFHRCAPTGGSANGIP
ncbi:hypothetical protein AGOR_G00246330 [Albula goreensis]|uniref:Uncharacterized protein n=1 Tax=Albula goreensis TaxID=1534307 RepID=A0A8T3CAR0_9TELE|nr:hypothetical protein AGOR_G00246330 [Albula goreensis]